MFQRAIDTHRSRVGLHKPISLVLIACGLGHQGGLNSSLRSAGNLASDGLACPLGSSTCSVVSKAWTAHCIHYATAKTQGSLSESHGDMQRLQLGQV